MESSLNPVGEMEGNIIQILRHYVAMNCVSNSAFKIGSVVTGLCQGDSQVTFWNIV